MAASAPPMARADVITDWNATAISTNTGPSSAMAARALATMHAAMFDAVNAVARAYQPYLVDTQAPAGASAEAAAAAAAHTVLSKMTTGQQTMLDAAMARTLGTIADGQGKVDGVRVGTEIGEKLVAARQGDGSERPPVYTVVPGVGKWVPTPPANAPFGFAHWGQVKPFVLARADAFPVAGPPALDSDRYLKDFEEVKALGARMSATRTVDQTAAALFWTVQTNIPWNAAGRAAAAARNLSLIESARLFAAMNMANHDALVAGWHVKAAMPFWRPITAIRQAADLKDPRFTPDPRWEPLINTPPHPDYVSGHCVGSGAYEAVLKALVGDTVSVSVVHPWTGQMRSYTSLTQMADEVDNARVWAGIHTRTADVDGRELGRRIGEAVVKRFAAKP